MNTRADKTQDNKGPSPTPENADLQVDNEDNLQFSDNRPETSSQQKIHATNNNSEANRTAQLQTKANASSQNVAQLVTYKGTEYSRELGNIRAFHAEANSDLDGIDSSRDKRRDKKMLNVIGNSDHVIDTGLQLMGVIHPTGKGYQVSIDREFEVLRPIISKIIDLAAGAREMAPRLRNDDSTESHEYVIMNMVRVLEKNEEVKERVQWKKVDGIDRSAEAVKKAASFSMMTVLEYVDPDNPPSKKAQKFQAKELKKGERTMDENTARIAKTASEIEPEIRQSGDEQYLRGTVGAPADEHGGTHLNIGKKTATKPLLDEDPEGEGKGVLWASVWSEGVNEAFIEGGTDAEHEFRLISPFPDELEPALRAGNVEEFMTIAREGTIENEGANPWRAYYHMGKGELTTLGKEIVQLLQSGYVLE